ncbi:S53 family peptidase [Actinoallomurus sp. CA-150999]|uniref:S53 family peptidase n=1 Tax=Actinoallomurus sp. CA-150999 TaxID=3239887 RepID=UPI003D948EFD
MAFGALWRLATGAVALTLPAMVVFADPGQAASGTTPVAGAQPSWAVTSADRGPAAASTPINGRIWLAYQDPAGLARFDQEVSTPGNAAYGHYLTPAQFRAHFGPTRAQQRAVASWARSTGLAVTAVTNHYVAVKGSVAQAQRAFSVQLHKFLVKNQLQIAPESTPRVPAALAPNVMTITGLDSAPHEMKPADSLPPPPSNRWAPGPCARYYGETKATNLPTAYGASAPWNVCGYTPDQLRSAYGATRSGLTGKGVTVAVVDAYASPTILSDANTYFASHGDAGFATGQFTQNLPTSWNSVSACGNWFTEEHIDVEAAHAMAPDANIVYVGASSCNDNDFQDALARVVDNHLASIVSNSWTAPEDQETPALRATYDSILQQGNAEGIGMYFSSGDAGYNDPATARGAGEGSDKLQASYPASSPYATGVGGTALAIGSRGNYEYEADYGIFRDPLTSAGTSWADPLPGTYPADFYQGGGGGTSYAYSQPSYQAGIVPNSLSETLPNGTSAPPMRVTPDVAMDADPNTGMIIGLTATQPDGSTAYSTARWGGTSLAAPLFAGMQALAEQAKGEPIGFANGAIYHGYRGHLFTDITAQNPGNPLDFALNWYTNPSTASGPILTYLATTGTDGAGPALLAATPGYDAATGVGSPNYGYLMSFMSYR